MQTKVARLLSLNTEVFLMVHLMSPHQLLQTVIARDLSLNIKANLKFYVMSLHQWMRIIFARDSFHSMEITRY